MMCHLPFQFVFLHISLTCFLPWLDESGYKPNIGIQRAFDNSVGLNQGKRGQGGSVS
ncbi:hypothetical protein COLO4_08381 [Corchorus olitorius]|uniref:Uncharacterized protein n=1 Tax=Corchorus olitorius TaxID=93759 RepID=A0A1R3KG01_9ROSI|nr:hypothetical protein COLO4_08381 [Corchorus olitorius]